MKQNCWEFQKCGREPGGPNTGTSGICPASTEFKLHNVHGGMNAGRACWMVAGSRNPLESSRLACQWPGKDMGGCLDCDFYREVAREETDMLSSENMLVKMIFASV